MVRAISLSKFLIPRGKMQWDVQAIFSRFYDKYNFYIGYNCCFVLEKQLNSEINWTWKNYKEIA